MAVIQRLKAWRRLWAKKPISWSKRHYSGRKDSEAMREYKLVLLNMSAHFSKQKNIADAEKALNDTASKGWILKQIYGVPDLSGTLLAVFYKEK